MDMETFFRRTFRGYEQQHSNFGNFGGKLKGGENLFRVRVL